ncbi:MAG: hypothetical protein QF535_18445 [Anaerolineales bacterium]|jgi:hypothetical protein|nr:hypothetical protein [Anaerolineales bacterium]|tara:strand:+ start:88 stop:309 length:222 start_codon:yes stop_codon:yes gene_type:complete
MMTVKVQDLVKGDWYIIDNGLLSPVRAKLIESPRQGRGYKSAVLMDVKGSDCGLFDEMGSVYVTDIVSEHNEE